MFSTIWMWTHEWSDIPSRSAFTCATCHHAFSWSSALAASSSVSSLRLPRVGQRMRSRGHGLRGCGGQRGRRARPDRLSAAQPTLGSGVKR